jgi:signal transduction histidine kinase
MQQSIDQRRTDQAGPEGRSAAALDAIDTGVAVVDDTGSIVVCNKRFFAMLDRAGLLAPVHATMEQGLLVAMPLNAVAPALSNRPAQVCGPGGRVFDISYKMDPPGLHGTLIQLRDITGQVIDNNAVDEARLKAEQIERARNAFVSQVAHHFRTPLHVILGYVDILTDTPEGALDPQVRNSYLEFIREAAAALLLNMNEMMEIIRLQRSELDIEAEPCDLGVLLDMVAGEVQADLEAEQARLDAADAIAGLAGVMSVIDIRLARRGLNSLVRTCAVLGGQGCTLQLSHTFQQGAACLTLTFTSGRAKPADVVASIESQEPVKEISLTGRASGYGIVLAVLLLQACNARVAVESGETREVVVHVTFSATANI